MSKLAKTLQAAAGNAGGEATYVEDVFSTYLYTGNGSTQLIENGIALGDTNAGPCVPFNGSQYLSRTSDLTGNSDGSTFTLSFWAFVTNTYSTIFKSDTGRVEVLIANNRVEFDFKNTSGTSIWRGNSASNTALNYQWNHILISVDAGSNANIYINDVSSAISYVANTSGTFDFTATSWGIGAPAGGGYQPIQGKMTEFFFDKTYRNLGIEANRRLFITADGEPATGLASLNPLIYLPLNDTVSVGTNEGTGGDFVPINGLSSSETGGPYTEAGYGQGGMVWVKDRNSGAKGHHLVDTERGASKDLQSQSANPEVSTNTVSQFNSDGFQVGVSNDVNSTATLFASWTFRKAPKFFDVVTWTGDDTTNRTHAHNLGSVPGLIIVKATSRSSNWTCYHRSLGNTKGLSLNSTDAAYNTTAWNSTSPTDSVFTATSGTVNEGGQTYVAYLFAHDAGGFGDDGLQNVISCGSYTGNGSTTGPVITLGYEPQWLLVKKSSGAGDWVMVDNMRGITTGGIDPRLWANLSNAENTGDNLFKLNATGFQPESLSDSINASSQSYIYIAIRRPMKTPESGTEVFAPEYGLNASAGGQAWSAGFPVDMYIRKNPTGGTNYIASRMTGNGPYMATDSTAAESSIPYSEKLDNMDGVFTTTAYDYTTWISWMFRRAPGFMDVVATPQTAAGYGTVTHNLGVAPEFIILKGRDYTESWRCYHAALGRGAGVQLNLPDARFLAADYWGAADPTATEFGVYWGYFSSPNYIAYLFATLPGISKVGSYSGTGADINVDCGFSAGARFVLIKRTDSTGDWYVWDSVRGIVSGNDPYLLLNSTTAEVTSTDYIDPLSSGFTVTSSAPAALNASGGSYIFLAIA